MKNILYICIWLMWIYNPQTSVNSEPLPYTFPSEHHINLSKMQSQTCTACLQEKPISEFRSHKFGKYGRQSWCRPCEGIKGIERGRTISGVIRTIYNSQRQSSRFRNHPMPSYTFYELERWILSQDDFKHIYDCWVKSNYNTMEKPSCDRLNNEKPYSLDNLRITTWGDNKQQYREDIKSGLCTKHCKPVLQYELTGDFIKEHQSINGAARCLNICAGHISRACNGKLNKTGGFIWKFKNKNYESNV